MLVCSPVPLCCRLAFTFTFSNAFIPLILLSSIQNFQIGLRNILVLLCSVILQNKNDRGLLKERNLLLLQTRQKNKNHLSFTLIQNTNSKKNVKYNGLYNEHTSGDLHCPTVRSISRVLRVACHAPINPMVEKAEKAKNGDKLEL